ncbi:glycosyltransferase family A protein [Paracoccus jeotgali]|uniref:Glycosyltransferase 2-like domain-containing protein n=1 Tax=Paracoccus jeotgali TaxID=2065379 RepID=A0A2K9MIL7_9RHOB|nr:glycosyltransferase family A protein [Paracoccus jeotgali]AUM75332.1 hypothetical protein CYR75_14445 [Paracoccus jeotgali]
MTTPDLSLLVTLHNEAHLAGPALRSADLAIAAAEAAGFTVERLIGLDAATETTRRFCAQPVIAERWPCRDYDFRDPFLLRNALARAATGRWVAWLDGDDLISENWLVTACEMLRDAPPDETWVIHPELNWVFDGEENVFTLVDQADPLFSKAYLYFNNYWDMMSVYPRDLALAVPYAPRRPEQGYGYEDWHWNLATMAHGVLHRVAPGTIIAKRRRAESVSRANARISAVCQPSETLRIDRFWGPHLQPPEIPS